MSRLFVGNFDFEHELAAGDAARGTHPDSVARGANGSTAARRRQAELATVWLAAAEAGDAIWLPEPIEPEFFAEAARVGLPRATGFGPRHAPREFETVVPWGWSDAVRRWAVARGFLRRDVTPPSIEAVRAVNARSFSAAREQLEQCAPDGAQRIATLDELGAAIGALVRQAAAPEASRWVLKAEFGMSARERMLGRGPQVPDDVLRWATRRLARDGCLHLEPWVERVAETGLQFEIAADGGIELLGLTPLRCDPAGRYVGSRMRCPADERAAWDEAVTIGMRTCRAAAEAGYFGPLGIDAMRYRDADGRERVRPLQDVNARYTMGRLALGLRRLLHGDEVGSWLHRRVGTGSSGAEPLAGPDVREVGVPSGVRIVRTTPSTIGGHAARVAAVAVVAADEASLSEAEAALLGEGSERS